MAKILASTNSIVSTSFVKIQETNTWPPACTKADGKTEDCVYDVPSKVQFCKD